MSIDILSVSTQSDLRTFIFLPAKLYQNMSRWVPPLYGDEWNLHNPAANPALAHADVIRLLAFQSGKPVGRIMGIIQKKYNEEKDERTARFFQLDCIDDQAVAHALLLNISAWAKARHMEKLIGPYGFSDKDPQGLQIEGNEYLPVLGTPSHPVYLKGLVESFAMKKEIDCLSYTFPIGSTLPERYQNVIQRSLSQNALRVLEFTRKRELKPFILPVLRLVNETYRPLFGFVAMSEHEMKKLANQYMPILDPELVKVIIDKHEHVVAFVVAMPEMSAGIQRAKGKLFPFGFIHILRAARQATQLNLMLGAVKPGFRGIGLNALLAKSLFETARKRGFKTIDSHLILETNTLMRAECERLNGTVYKRYRVYQKSLL